MKKCLLLLLLLSGSNIYSQGYDEVTEYRQAIYSSQVQRGDEVITFKSNGDNLIFKDWDNKGDFFFKNRVHIFPKANFDYVKGVFYVQDPERRILYKLNNNLLDSVYLGKKSFMSVKLGGESKNVEKLFNSKDNFLIKIYKPSFIKAKYNALSGIEETKAKYIYEEEYFYGKLDNFKRIKLKRKEILKRCFPNKGNEVMKYLKKNKLKLKDERDLIKVLNFFNKQFYKGDTF